MRDHSVMCWMAVRSERERSHTLQVKNSLRAVNDRFEDSDDVPPPVRVIVAEGDEDVTIKAGSSCTLHSTTETVCWNAHSWQQCSAQCPCLTCLYMFPCLAGQDMATRSAVAPVRCWALQGNKDEGLLLLSISGCMEERVCADTGALLAGV